MLAYQVHSADALLGSMRDHSLSAASTDCDTMSMLHRQLEALETSIEQCPSVTNRQSALLACCPLGEHHSAQLALS